MPHTTDLTLELRSTNDPYRLHELRAISNHSFGSQSFSYVAPRLYNIIPVALKSLESVDTFKSHLKTFFFARSYDAVNKVITPAYVL